jgi:hypothetical protein
LGQKIWHYELCQPEIVITTKPTMEVVVHASNAIYDLSDPDAVQIPAILRYV